MFNRSVVAVALFCAIGLFALFSPSVAFADDPPPPPPPPACFVGHSFTNHVVKVAAADGRFSIFAQAVQVAGLENTFATNEGFTVFAPTDAAFLALPDGVLDGLLANPGQLRQVLLYHTLQDPYTAAEVPGLGTIRTSLGKDFSVMGTTINGSSTIVITDLMAENGIVHGINMVLTPPPAEFTTRNLPPAPPSEACLCLIAAQSAAAQPQVATLARDVRTAKLPSSPDMRMLLNALNHGLFIELSDELIGQLSGLDSAERDILGHSEYNSIPASEADMYWRIY